MLFASDGGLVDQNMQSPRRAAHEFRHLNFPLQFSHVIPFPDPTPYSLSDVLDAPGNRLIREGYTKDSPRDLSRFDGADDHESGGLLVVVSRISLVKLPDILVRTFEARLLCPWLCP